MTVVKPINHMIAGILVQCSDTMVIIVRDNEKKTIPEPILSGAIFSISLFIWLSGMLVLKRTSSRIDVTFLKMAWDNLKVNEELLMHINQQFERIERLVKPDAKVQPESDVPEEGYEI